MTPIPVGATQSSRRRPFILHTTELSSSTSTTRQTLLTPAKGFRVRVARVKIVQDTADGIHLIELFFGTANSLIADQSKAIDILRVPDLGSTTTHPYPPAQGPRGLRDEALSARWRSPAPANAHTIIIEYTEEP